MKYWLVALMLAAAGSVSAEQTAAEKRAILEASVAFHAACAGLYEGVRGHLNSASANARAINSEFPKLDESYLKQTNRLLLRMGSELVNQLNLEFSIDPPLKRSSFNAQYQNFLAAVQQLDFNDSEQVKRFAARLAQCQHIRDAAQAQLLPAKS